MRKFLGRFYLYVMFILRLLQVQASGIFVEEEVEYELRVMVENVKDSVCTLSIKGGNPKIVMWRTPFYDVQVSGIFKFNLDFQFTIFVTTVFTRHRTKVSSDYTEFMYP